MKTKILLYTFLFFSNSFLNISNIQAQCHQKLDSIDLVEIYHAGIDAGLTVPWDLTTPMDEWEGVTVNEMGCVISLKQDWNKVVKNFSESNVNYANFDPICHENDSLSLVALYDSTDGSNWTNTWDLSQPVHTWYGVTLNENGCVKKLDLDGTLLPNCPQCAGLGNDLNGTIPIELWTLTSLVELSLSGNYDLNGSLSPDISTLSNLTVLSLDNNLSGDIPAEINSLIFLNILKLSGNGNNTVPDFSALVNLTVFELHNFSVGLIPEWIKNFTNLDRLDLSGNNLEGIIPSWIGDLTNLSFFNLSYNNLTGEFPATINNLTEVRWFYMATNQLEGQLPNYSSFKPRFISLSRNKFTGILPAWINNSNAFSVSIDHNQFSGELPLFPENMRQIYIVNNQFTFEDLLPNFQENTARATTFIYAPQNNFFQETLLTSINGTDETIDLLIDEDIASNIYKWYKDGQLLSTINGNNKLTIENISNADEGVYYCEVTNPNISDLTLTSYNITINISDNCLYEYLDLFNPIPSDIYGVQTIVESSGVINNGSDVTFIAGNSVNLKIGFYAELGSNFVAKIDAGVMCDNSSNLKERNSEVKKNTLIPTEDISMNIYPSPFREKAIIKYRLPKVQKVSLIIYDLAGQIIRQFEQNTLQNKGVYQYELDNMNLNSGMYIVLLQSEYERISKKIILLQQ